jgi:hypothetical protein
MVTMEYLAEKAFDIYYDGGYFTQIEIEDYHNHLSKLDHISTPEIEAIQLILDKQLSYTPLPEPSPTPPNLSTTLMRGNQPMQPMTFSNYNQPHENTNYTLYQPITKHCHEVTKVWGSMGRSLFCYHQIVVKTPKYLYLLHITSFN